MRQCRGMEYLEDYYFTLHYHPSKANVVANALIWKSQGVLASVVMEQKIIFFGRYMTSQNAVYKICA